MVNKNMKKYKVYRRGYTKSGMPMSAKFMGSASTQAAAEKMGRKFGKKYTWYVQAKR